MACTVTPATSTVTCTTTISKKVTTTVKTTTVLFSAVGGAYVRRGENPEPTPTGEAELEFGESLQIGAPVDETESTAPAIQRRDAATAKPTAIPTYAANVCNRDSYASACSCIGTSTVTKTATVETTLPICDPAKNYGIQWYGGEARTPKGMYKIKTTDQIFEAAGAQSCCVRCFNTAGCLFYDQELSGRKCRLRILTTGNNTNKKTNTHLCPWGIMWNFPEREGKTYGLGPCNIPYADRTTSPLQEL
ncbi:hypothetical protein ABW19_dt0207480 [Dactylella cylindrospora]|nr:hypothetical protein ABW19_dt0207480 [Dactylella cylindrospora]